MRNRAVIATVLLCLVTLPLRGQGEIDAAIDKGVDWLLRMQEVDGSWKGPSSDEYPVGMTALSVYTLSKCGLPRSHRAILKGLAFMKGARCHRTYGAGVYLMACQALGGKVLPKREKELVKLLLDGRQKDRWSYPRPSSDRVDLSITQYGVLGLRAAAAMGYKITDEVWKDVALGLMDCQASYGGWGYRKTDGKLTASMTVAGLGCLLVCSKQLENTRHVKLFQRRIKGNVDRGLLWLGKHWSVEHNLVAPAPDKQTGPDRWLYYYLYGLERVGSFSGQSILAGHNWYEEGSKLLLKKQGKKGAWGSPYGERDMNTCFALLFLRRGSRSTGIPPRVRLQQKKVEKEVAFLVGMNQENPRLAWVRTLNAGVKERLAAGERIESVEWRSGDTKLAEVIPLYGKDPTTQDYLYRWPLETNGVHKLQAVMHFVDEDGASTGGEVSNTLAVKIDSIVEPADEEVLGDAGKNLVARTEVRASASSSYDDGRRAERAGDGTWCTHWLCARDDRKPWVRIDLKTGVRARKLKFGSAHRYASNKRDYARPREVRITLNGSRRYTLTCADDLKKKHTLEFPALRVHSVRITIKSLYPGKDENKELVGIQEIELYY